MREQMCWGLAFCTVTEASCGEVVVARFRVDVVAAIAVSLLWQLKEGQRCCPTSSVLWLEQAWSTVWLSHFFVTYTPVEGCWVSVT